MAQQRKYKNISQILRRMRSMLRKVEDGEGDLETLDSMLSDVRALEERLIIIRYKAYSELYEQAQEAKMPKQLSLLSEEEEKQMQALEEVRLKELREREVQYEIQEEEEVLAEDNSQISLIDSIEEIDREKKDRHIEGGAGLQHGELEQKPEVHISTKEQGMKMENPKIDLPEESETKFNEKNQVDEQKQTLSTDEAEEKETLSVAEKMEQQAIESILTALSINQKIGLLKRFFKSNEEAFAQGIQALDSSEGAEEALRKFEFMKPEDIEDDDDFYQGIVDLIQRRHSA